MQNNHVVTSERWPDPNRQDKCENISVAANAKDGATVRLVDGVTVKLKTPSNVKGIDTNGFRYHLAKVKAGVSSGDTNIDRVNKQAILYSDDGDVTWAEWKTAFDAIGSDYTTYFGTITVASPVQATDKVPVVDDDEDYWFSSYFSVGGHDGHYVQPLDYSHFLAFSSQNPFMLRTMSEQGGLLPAYCEVRATYVSRRLARGVGFAIGLVDSSPIKLTMERGRVLIT